jgi:radical SAM superfamily enzyme YgiQ (UPF0313 family)
MERKKVVLFHPRTFHEKNYANFWIPYSILSIGSELKQQGYDVRLIDNNLESLDKNGFGATLEKDTAPLFVGISSMIGHQIKEGLEFATSCREIFPNAPIVWGGAAPTILSQDFISSLLVDIIVRSQGEKTATELADALASKKNLDSIEGIWFKHDGKTKTNSNRKILPKDQFANYDYALLPVKRYLRQDEHISDKVLNYLSSQGCPFGCGFCSEVALYDRKWTAQSKERVIEEVSNLVEKYGANGIKFYDANFFANKNRALAFSKAVKEKDWNITWAASAHPKNLLTFNYDELKTVKDSGCSRILIGAESGNNTELKYINKNMTTEDVVAVAKLLDKVGIHGSFTIIVGYPGFPEENIEKTLKFGEKIANISLLHEVKAHVYAPYPGTPLYQDAIKYGFVPPKTLDDWANYDYYEVQTPWLKTDLNKDIRTFNKEHCPYVL